jgi:predicted peptidase
MIQLLPLLFVLQAPTSAVQRLTLPLDDAEPLRYALSVPRGDAKKARPLIVALHPGGPRFPYYGAAFVEQVIGPAAAGLDAIIIAPDCQATSWTDPAAEAAVLTLIKHVKATHPIDDRRVIVAGFSMGARGAWFFSSRHPELVNGAVIGAGNPTGEPIHTLARTPTYVFHSRADEVVRFDPTDEAVRELERLKRDVRFERLDGLKHYDTVKYVPSFSRGIRWVVGRLR